MVTLLELSADHYPEYAGGERITFTMGTFKIRCFASKPAILAVAAKLAKGLPADLRPENPYRFSIVGSRNPSFRQTFSRETLGFFLADGETENAEAYVALQKEAGK